MGGSVAALVVGLVAGVLSGAFGVGGGIVTTPAIRLVLGYPALIAVGTPLPLIVPTALAGAWSYRRAGLLDVRASVIIGACGLPLTVVGAWLSDVAGGRTVLLMTAALVAYMAFDVLSAPRTLPAADALEARRVPTLVLLGVVAGAYSGFLGLGGGFVIVPVLTRTLGMPIKRAIGTSLLAVALLAVPGSVVHWSLGHVDLGLAATMALGVVPGALIGARLTRTAADKSVRNAFAALLGVTAIAMVVNETGLLG